MIYDFDILNVHKTAHGSQQITNQAQHTKGGCTQAHWLDKKQHTRVYSGCDCILRTQDNRKLQKQNRGPYIKKSAHAHNY
jgi:hypothetical protein